MALDLNACPDPAPAEVRALLALELRERLLPEAAPTPAGAQHVEVACDEREAQLTLREAQVTRALALASVQPELRARLLALSIAELLQQHTPGQPALTPPPAPAPASAPTAAPREQTRRAGPSTLPRYALWAGAELSATPLLAWGGSLLFRARIARLWAWSSALGFSQGSTDIDRGSLRVQSVALRTGPALLFENERGALSFGAGARVGLWLLRGRPDDRNATDSAAFRSPYAGPALFAGGTLRLGKHALLALELELAYTMRRVRADVEGGGAHTLGAWRSSALLGAGATW